MKRSQISTVNDDSNDHVFRQAVGRYSSIEEDEVPYRLLVTDYAAHTPFTTPQSSD